MEIQLYYLWTSKTISEYLENMDYHGWSTNCPHDPYAGEPDCLGACVGRGRLGANLVSIGCGILSIAQVARSFPATAPLPAVGIHWATQALGGGEARRLAVIQRLGEAIILCPDPANSCPRRNGACAWHGEYR
jgi:hypothetical protein